VPRIGYSPAIRHGEWVFTAGAIASDYFSKHWERTSAVAPEALANPHFWHRTPIEVQTEYVLARLEEIVEEAGSSLEHCVHAGVYLGHPDDFAGMNRIWRKWFPEAPPARTVVPYMGLGGRGCRVEIALTLIAKDARVDIERVVLDDIASPMGHEPHAVRAGDLVFFSTVTAADQFGRLPGELESAYRAPFTSGAGRREMEVILEKIARIADACGSSVGDICRAYAFFGDLTTFPEMMSGWRDQFSITPPALTAVEVGGPPIAPEARVFVEAIATVKHSAG
jgi:enamine deaminase RidA (YjgF/YER057c/UK114 family)